MSNYYVYVYIDPRNFEEFYYGKGKGSRKHAHLNDDSDSEKSRRIKAIKKEGLEPIVRVIARCALKAEHQDGVSHAVLVMREGPSDSPIRR